MFTFLRGHTYYIDINTDSKITNITETYTLPNRKQRARGSVLYDTGNPKLLLCANLEGWDGQEVWREWSSGWGGTYGCLWSIHTVSQSVHSLSRVRLFTTPWTAAHQASLSITNSQSSLKLMSIESVMPSSHLILCRPLLLLPPISPSIRVFSNESTLRMRWPKYWSFSFSIIPSNEYLHWRMAKTITIL